MRGLTGRIATIALALTLAPGFASPMGAPTAALAEGAAAYEHLWQAETVLGGERGRTVKRVALSEVRLSEVEGDFTGGIEYSDVLGAQDPSGIHSQSASIELALEGAYVEAGRVAGGTFEGRITFVDRTALSLEEAVSELVDTRSDGVRTAYEVSGHWGARIADGVATGEVLYERASLLEASDGAAPPHDVAWFNRLGPKPPGAPQSFAVALNAPLPEGDGGEGDGRGHGGDGEGDAPAVPAASPEADAADGASGDETGFWEHVLRGLTGGTGPSAVPASPASIRAARSLRDARPTGAVALPDDAVSVDLDVSGAYLDALNRGAGLLDDTGPTGFDGQSAAWRDARASVPGRPAVRGDEDPAAFWAEVLSDALAGQDAAGTEDLARQAADVASGMAAAEVAEVRAWAFAAEAVGGEPIGSVLAETAAAVARVREAPLPEEGDEHDIALAAAASPRAPRDVSVLAAFRRAPSEDASAPAAPATLPGAVLARSGETALTWTADGERRRVSPQVWEAWVRDADGRAYFLAGPGGPAALTDGALKGWAFAIPRAWLVDPAVVGRILAEYPTG